MENWSQISLVIMFGLVGVFTRRPVAVGLFAALLTSWHTWLAAFCSKSGFWGAGHWALGFSVVFFVVGYFVGFVGIQLVLKFHLEKWNKLMAVALVASMGFYFLAPIAIEKLKKKEWEDVTKFVENNEEVKANTSDKAGIGLICERRSRWAFLPKSYEVSIAGTKRLFAVVDVSRSLLGPSTFFLSCITSVEGVRVTCDQ